MWYCADFSFDNTFYQLSVNVTDSWSILKAKMNQEDQGAIYQKMGIFVIKKEFFLLKLVVFLIGGVQKHLICF
jgi:hypothetical protein